MNLYSVKNLSYWEFIMNLENFPSFPLLSHVLRKRWMCLNLSSMCYNLLIYFTIIILKLGRFNFYFSTKVLLRSCSFHGTKDKHSIIAWLFTWTSRHAGKCNCSAFNVYSWEWEVKRCIRHFHHFVFLFLC